MRSALIGYTGFVGSNLSNQRSFDRLYNSRNFRELEGEVFDEIICAGVSAIKWQANKEPEKDKAKIKELSEVLKTVKTKRFFLISTIDVYPVIRDKDESFDCHTMNNHPYGTHRLAFEDFCMNQFNNCYIFRLPGLFGKGLKKNVIYDLLNDNCLEMINPASSFQYYYLKNLWADIQKVAQTNVKLINLFTEPVATSTIIDRFFPDKDIKPNPARAAEAHYSLHTSYAKLWGKDGQYIYSHNEMIEQLEEFIRNHK
ncbi:hypothetical protein ACFL4R_00130 [Nitrospirota bacterium]